MKRLFFAANLALAVLIVLGRSASVTAGEQVPFKGSLEGDVTRGAVMHTFTANDPDMDPLTWTFIQLLGPGGALPAIAPTFDASTQKLTWDTTGSVPGTWIAQVQAGDPGGLTDLGSLTINLQQSALEHFLGYEVKATSKNSDDVERTVRLTDQFGTGTFLVEKVDRLYNPTAKTILPQRANLSSLSDPSTHLLRYTIEREDDTSRNYGEVEVEGVVVTNQFGTFLVDVEGPTHLLVPSQKALKGTPLPPVPGTVDHFLCYETKAKFKHNVSLADQFGTANYKVKKGVLLCNPVEKTVLDENGSPLSVTPIQNPNEHLMCFTVEGPKRNVKVHTDNQFGPTSLTVSKPRELCVPSQKQLGGNGLHLDASGLSRASGALLTEEMLDPVIADAFSYWAGVGVDTASLPSVRVQVADLAESLLGLAYSNTILIDRDAAGYGWSLDSSSADTVGVDLRSAVTHELGHLL